MDFLLRLIKGELKLEPLNPKPIPADINRASKSCDIPSKFKSKTKKWK